MITQIEAIEKIKQYAAKVFKEVSFDVVDQLIELRFAGVESEESNSVNKFYGRVAIAIPIQKQANLGEVTNVNKRRYRNQGILNIDLYCPKSATNSYEIGRSVCSKMRYHYANRTIDDITYENPRVDDSYRTDKAQYVLSFYVDFLFDEVI